jgi:YVTN family beta-propeller protein
MVRISLFRTLVLFMATVLALTATGAGQGRPDIRWMRGGHVLGSIKAKYSPDGQWLASVADDGTLKIWRVSDHMLVRTVLANPLYTRAVAWSPDSLYVATGSSGSNHRVALWGVADGTMKWSIDSFNELSPSGLSFSPDGQYLAIAAANGGTAGFIVRTLDGGLVRDLKSQNVIYGAGAIQYSPDGQYIATNTWLNSRLVLLNASTGALVHDFGFDATFGYSIAFSNDGNYMAVVNGAGLKVYRMSVFSPLAALGASGGVEMTDVAFSPDSRRLAAGGDSLLSGVSTPIVWLWDVATGNVVSSTVMTDISSFRPTVDFSRDSSKLLTAGSSIQLWNAQDGQYLEDFSGHSSDALSVRFSPDGEIFASSGNLVQQDHKIRLWRVSDGQLLHTLDTAGRVPWFEIAPDGQSLVAISSTASAGNLQRWRLSDGSQLWSVPAGGRVTGKDLIAFLPDGQSFLSGTASGIEVRRISDGVQIAGITFRGGPSSLAISRDGQNVFTVDSDLITNGLNLRRLSDGLLLRTFAGNVSAFALSRDGQWIATADFTTHAISVWRVSSDGQPMQTLTGHTQVVDALSFSSDGATLTSGSRGTDGTLRIWDTAHGTLLRFYDEETGMALAGYSNVTSLAISPDGSKLGYARTDATVVMAQYPYGPPANRPPVASGSATPNPAEAQSLAGSSIRFDGSLSSDPDLDTLSFAWQESGGTIATGRVANVVLPLGHHAVTLVVTDSHGAAGSSIIPIDVVDTTSPVIMIPSSLNIRATSAGGAAVYFAASATDLVDGSLPAVCAPASGSIFPVGVTTVTCTAMDAHGNSRNAQLVITVTPQSSSPTWRLMSSMSTPRWGHTATLLPNGKVLFAGGSDGVNALSSVELYDPSANLWSAGPGMQTPRIRATATVLGDGRVLVFGGQQDNLGTSSATAEIYDPASNHWTAVGSMNIPRSYHTATLLADGRVLATGGDNAPAPNNDPYQLYELSAEIFDPATGLWTTVAPMHIRRVGHVALALNDGRVLVAGGANYAQYESTAEVYSPSLNVWTTVESMSTQRYAGAGQQLPDGRVLITGGRFFSPQRSSEIFNPQTNTWSSAGEMSDDRWFFALTRLSDGRLMALGGGNALTQLDTADIYDPSTGQWTAADSMNHARADHSETLLSDGHILAVGGYRDGGTQILSSAEIWGVATPTSLVLDPVSGPFAGSVTLSATLTSASLPVAGKTITFSLFGSTAGTAVTNSNGVATLGPMSLTGHDAGVFPGGATATFAGNSIYSASGTSADLTITRVSPLIQLIGGTFQFDGALHAAQVTLTDLVGAALSPINVSYNELAAVPSAVGSYLVLASYDGSVNYVPVHATATLTITDHIIDGPTAWQWFQNQWPSRHTAQFADGGILAETWTINTVPVLNPQTGAGTLFPANFNRDGVMGQSPNPVVWTDGTASTLIGAYGPVMAYNQNGTMKWRWDNSFGCCNVFGTNYLTIDKNRRRLLASLGYRLYTLPLDGGPTFLNNNPPVTFSEGGQAFSGSVTATADTVFVASGISGWISKWDISGDTPNFQWTRPLGGSNRWNFSDGAIARDGSYAVTQSGDHASAAWNDINENNRTWRAGDLYWSSADGQTGWAIAALATTPPVIGRSGLIYVGALAATGSPQQLDQPGYIRAFNPNGQQIWATPTSGVPQDLLIGDDGNLYALAGGSMEGRILALDQATGALRMVIDHLPKPWEIMLRDGVIYVSGDTGVAAVPVPPGFAVNYDLQSPWPVRQHDNQRSSQQLPSSTLAVSAASAVHGGTATLVATLNSPNGPVAGKAISFSLFGISVGTAATNTSGVAALSVSVAGRNIGFYPGAIGASFAGDSNFDPSSSSSDLTIVDATAPLIDVVVTGTLGNNGWYRGDVTIVWSVVDPESSISSTVGCNASSVTADTTGVTLTCSATSAGGTSSRSVTIMRDTIAPGLTISQPAAGGLLGLGQPLPAIYLCADASSGVNACNGTVANGATLDTATAGTRTFVVSASDAAGNTASQTVYYTVLNNADVATEYLYVPNRLDGTVSVVDTRTNLQVATIPVGPSPTTVVFSRDGQRAYVSNLNSGFVSVIDTASRTNIGSLTVGNGPWGLAVSPDGTRLYSANLFSRTVTAVDIATGQTVASAAVAGNVRGLGMTPDGRYLFAADTTEGLVEVIETASFATVAVIPTGNQPQQAAVTPDGSRVLVPTLNAIAVIEVSRIASCPAMAQCPGAILMQLARTAAAVPAGQPVTIAALPDVPNTVAFSADGAQAYITHTTPGGLMTVLDTASFTLSMPRSLNNYPYGVAVGINGPRVYVGAGGGTSVYVMDTPSNTVLTEAGVGAQPGLLAISPVATSLSVLPVSGVYRGRVTFSASLAFSGTPVIGRKVTFTMRGAPVGSAITGINGVAALPNIAVGAVSVGSYDNDIAASFTGDSYFLPSAASSSLTISKATPAIVWAPPAPIVYGSLLNSAQLNAISSVAGSFHYSPDFGARLPAGAGQSLAVHFAPNDTTSYTDADMAVEINVLKATPNIVWPKPNEIIDGTALGATQLNAMTSVPGVFTYTPSVGTVLHTGSLTLSTSFTPTDAANYNSTVATVIQVVAPPLFVSVTSPNGGEKVFGASSYLINWSASGGVGGGPSSFDLAYSTDSGATFVPIPGCVGLSGTVRSCTWVAPNPATSKARVRVSVRDAAANMAFDSSDGDFTISTGAPFISITKPMLGTIWRIGFVEEISWQHNLGVGSTVRIDWSKDDGNTWILLNGSVQNSGSGSGSAGWIIPNTPTTAGRIRITWLNGANASAVSERITVNPLSIAVTVPDSTLNVTWAIGKDKQIKWSHNIPGTIVWRIEISRDFGASWLPIAEYSDSSSGTSDSYTWTVSGPSTTTGQAKLRITAVNYNITATSPQFTIK